MGENNERKNMVMITVTLPDVSDENAIAIKKTIEDAVQSIDDASIELRLRHAKAQPRGLPGGV